MATNTPVPEYPHEVEIFLDQKIVLAAFALAGYLEFQDNPNMPLFLPAGRIVLRKSGSDPISWYEPRIHVWKGERGTIVKLFNMNTLANFDESYSVCQIIHELLTSGRNQ